MRRHRVLVLLLSSISVASCDSRSFDRTFHTQFGDAREAVRRDLKDPYSAQFEDLTGCAGNPEVVSGMVNAKNAMGAYVGKESFFAKRSVAAFYRDPMFDDLARECYGKDPIWKDYLASIPSDIDRYQTAIDVTR